MNQKSRQESNNSVEKDFYKLMNNSNFGYDCRNNLYNCKFVPIFDEYQELTFISRYHNLFDSKVRQFITSDLLKKDIEEKINDKLSKLDKEDRFYEIKLQLIKNARMQQIEATEKFEGHKKKKIEKQQNWLSLSIEEMKRLLVKSLIDFDEEYSCSIKSITIEKNKKVKLTTRFLNGKMLMFSKVSIKSFVYDLIDVFMFPTQKIQEIYQKYQVEKCYLYQSLTDTDRTSVFFIFICNLNCSVSEEKARNTTFEVMLKSKVFDCLDLSAEFYEPFNCRNATLKERVGLFEIENIDKPNVITIALNPKEYYERFIDHPDNKKHKAIKNSTPGMDFDSYSNYLSDLTEYFSEFLTTDNKVEKSEQRRFQGINESMQMKSESKIQFGQLNEKGFYFSNEMVSLRYGHPSLEKLRKEKHKYHNVHKVIQTKKDEFLLKESKILESIPRLNILSQIFAQTPILYELNSDTKFLAPD